MFYRMSITEEPYQNAEIYQSCSACKWNSAGAPQELETCPQCGSPVSGTSTMLCRRGGVSYHEDENCFYFWNGDVGAGTAHVYSCDVRNILIFLAKHYSEWGIDKMLGRN